MARKTQIEKLTDAFNVIADHFDSPKVVKQFDPASKVWEETEVNTLRYQQQDFLYWARVALNRSLDKNVGYAESLVKKLKADMRSFTGDQIALETVARTRSRLEVAHDQQAHLSAAITAITSVWEDRYPERQFEMPKSRPAPAAKPSTASKNAVEAELAAIAALGIDVSGVDIKAERFAEAATE